MTIVDPAPAVTGGVDTHLELNVAAAVDHIGGLLGVAEFPTTSSGHKELLAWLKAFGPLAKVGIEGTSSYGAGLARSLRRAGIEVAEVARLVFLLNVIHGTPRRSDLARGSDGIMLSERSDECAGNVSGADSGPDHAAFSRGTTAQTRPRHRAG